MSKVIGYPDLDPLKAPLTGVNLVEANAGTGKTYNIVSLYLRLLLESSMTVDQILVVSFTEAATAELRERIRLRLRELQQVFETGTGEDDAVVFLQCCADRERGLRKIIRALQSFDQAAIFTIHGFCQRLLSDAAFEAGLSEATRLITDDSALRRELIDDFWHTETSEGSRLWVQYLLDHSGPGELVKQLTQYFGRPLIRRVTPAMPAAASRLEEDFRRTFETMREHWEVWREEIASILYNDRGLNKNTYRQDRLAPVLIEADDWVYCGGVSLKKLKKLERLGAAKIKLRTRKTFTPPEHEAFDLFQQLLDIADQLQPTFAPRLAHMHRRLLEFADTELPRRKQEQRVWHFDDLLTELYAALQSPHAPVLRQTATQQYHAALIDEFQDTDPLQFAIFDSLFCQAATPVFFVGDPKQAIYGFRGADVYAYLEARDRASGRYNLGLNYRSTQALVESVNTVFGQNQNPFVIDKIGFHPSTAKKNHAGLQIDGKTQPALQWWYVPDKDVAATDNTIEEMIAASVATEIAGLMQHMQKGRVSKPEDKLLEAGDIAVLVNTHKQGRMVRDALSQRGIASMQRTEDNVFQTLEADELYFVLRAVVEPSRYPLVRAALATDLLGYDAKQIDALEHDDTQWQDLLDRFAGYPDTWRQHGFSRMYRLIARDFGVEQRLLAFSDGQRRVTNLVHLADLLQRESSQRRGGMEEILVWMYEQRQIERPDDQTMLLRLESDENLINIATVHFSKGLQYPVVFCPYLWTVMKPRKKPLVEFHDEQNRASLDLGSPKESVFDPQAQMESLAERVRLAYVALTRAELACWAVWGTNKSKPRSSLNWLLNPESAGEPVVSAVDAMTSPDSETIAAKLAKLQCDTIETGPMPAPSARKVGRNTDVTVELQPRVLKHEVRRGWGVSSFSALTRHVIEEPRDYDAGKSIEQPVLQEPTGIFAFPRGARAGRCMHALLENIVFDATLAEIEPVAEKTLDDYGFAKKDAPVLAQMAVNVLQTNLGQNKSIQLCDVGRASRVVEMEFYFPIATLDAGRLRTALGEFGNGTPIEARLEKLEFRVGDGFMHGFIDLVFESANRYYVVDYKSNWLGGEITDYDADRLQAEIAKHDYYLQYLIYSLALHRYLAQRLPDYDYERHFGGAYYLFLRGMHPDTGANYGVYHDRPDWSLMQRLDQLFSRGGAK